MTDGTAVAEAARVSEATLVSQRFVEAHRAEASSLGRRLVGLVDDPDAFTAALRDGLAALGDPAYIVGERLIAPGIGPILGVRQPLLTACYRAFRTGTRRTSSAQLLYLLERLMREELREIRWLAIWNAARLLPTDPERTWQLLRRAGREADEWITVDTLAHPFGIGILLDARRWAELEQLVYSPSRWERRLVGSTLATIPYERRLAGHRDPEIAGRGLRLIDELIGDDEPDVQKALSWALRSLTLVDSEAVGLFVERQADLAVEAADGARAWVVRDSLAKLPADDAARVRERLRGLRRRHGAGSTSRAARLAAEFLASLPASPVVARPQHRSEGS